MKKEVQKMCTCETCTQNGNGRILLEVEARLHRDANPHHTIIDVDKDNDWFETIEQEKEAL